MRNLLLVCLLVLAACVTRRTETGVANTWRDASLLEFEMGKTTYAEVAKRLGPPSQLIDLENQIVYYYLNERARKDGLVLILYNEARERVVYDRAIFFFSKPDGVLEDYALSLEETPYVPPAKIRMLSDERPAEESAE